MRFSMDSWRAMIMDYLYFVFSTVVFGCVIFAVCRICFSQEPQRDLVRKAAPPRKSVVSGLSPEELERLEFQNRIDVWQKGHEIRREVSSSEKAPISGAKYQFTPSPRKRIQVGKRFELIN